MHYTNYSAIQHIIHHCGGGGGHYTNYSAIQHIIHHCGGGGGGGGSIILTTVPFNTSYIIAGGGGGGGGIILTTVPFNTSYIIAGGECLFMMSLRTHTHTGDYPWHFDSISTKTHIHHILLLYHCLVSHDAHIHTASKPSNAQFIISALK